MHISLIIKVVIFSLGEVNYRYSCHEIYSDSKDSLLLCEDYP